LSWEGTVRVGSLDGLGDYKVGFGHVHVVVRC